MALRNILKIGDEALYKRSREVTEIDDRIRMLLDDMAQTMREANGLGLAAPQVGILRRVVIIDVEGELIELINPEIIETSDEEAEDIEGCLSVPGKWGYVSRPKQVRIKAKDRNGKEFEMTGEGLLARAFCHETEHLDGHLFVEKVIRYCEPDEIESKKEHGS